MKRWRKESQKQWEKWRTKSIKTEKNRWSIYAKQHIRKMNDSQAKIRLTYVSVKQANYLRAFSELNKWIETKCEIKKEINCTVNYGIIRYNTVQYGIHLPCAKSLPGCVVEYDPPKGNNAVRSLTLVERPKCIGLKAEKEE